MSKGPARRIRLRAVVAYPAVSLAMVAAIALVLTPFGSAQSMALDATLTATETVAPTATATTEPTAPPTTTDPTTAPPTTSASKPPAASSPSLTPSPTPIQSPTPTPLSGAVLAPGPVLVEHHVIARIEGAERQANYLPVDQDVPDAERFQTFRVRFKLRNAGATPIALTPQLEFRADTSRDYSVVPEKYLVGIPFHVNREWIPSLDLDGGTMQGPLGEDIQVADLRTGNAGGGRAVTGHRSTGANADQPMTLPPGSYTEEEFTVRLSIDAKYLTGYVLRITDAGTALTGTQVATIRLGEPRAFQPSTQQGIAVAAPQPAGALESIPRQPAPPIATTTSPASALSSARSAFPASFVAPAVSDLPRYALLNGTVSTAVTGAVSAAVAAATDPVHGPYSMTSDRCAVCHRSHTGKGRSFLVSNPQSTLCFTCHDGTGATTNVKATYTDPTVPQNIVSDRKIYRHDTLQPTSSHTLAYLNEFGGRSDRHTECSDCHNSHNATATDSVATTTGFTASGRLQGSSGVSVVNGAAGAAPTYTFLSGVDTNVVPANLVTREYQLCFKCHSGFTILDSNAGFGPSRYRLDKGIEFNPANPSYHPVEAAGKNQSTKMRDSLAGPSPYKQWNFLTTSVISCANCHSNNLRFNLVSPPSPNASSPLHASANAGILRQNYRNRLLKPVSEPYKDSDFALCLMCHSNTPFANETGTATNFGFHGYHLTKLIGQGSANAMIDTPGAGGGNAICAECHFRQHSTTFKNATPLQTVTGSRLVSFAPNVEPLTVGGTITWTRGADGSGSCSLKCHGKSHTPETYSGAP